MDTQTALQTFLAFRGLALVDRLQAVTGADLEVCARALPRLASTLLRTDVVIRWSTFRTICREHGLDHDRVAPMLRDVQRELVAFNHATAVAAAQQTTRMRAAA